MVRHRKESKIMTSIYNRRKQAGGRPLALGPLRLALGPSVPKSDQLKNQLFLHFR